MYLKKSKATYKVYKKKNHENIFDKIKIRDASDIRKVSGIIHHSFTIQMDSKILVSD